VEVRKQLEKEGFSWSEEILEAGKDWEEPKGGSS